MRKGQCKFHNFVNTFLKGNKLYLLSKYNKMSRSKRIPLLKVASFIISIVITCLFPFILILLSPVYIFRLLVSQAAKRFRPDLGKLLTTRSTLFTAMDLNLVNVCAVSGKLDIETVHQILISKLKEKLGEEYLYPELQQYVHNWMGFAVWKWDNKFDIRNHLTLLSPQSFTPAQAKEMGETLLVKPFEPKRSPWELIVVHNYIDNKFDRVTGPKSLVFFRVHHTLCDGFSLLKFVLNVAANGNKELEKVLERQKKIETLSARKAISNMWSLLKFLYEFTFLTLNSFSIAPWGLKASEYSRDYFCLTTPKINCNYIKTIQRGYNVGFSSVLIAAMTAGVRKGLQLKSKYPDAFYIGLPFPAPGHPHKLRNYLTAGIFELPVNEPDSSKRLQNCHSELLNAKNSSIPKGLFLTSPILGGLFCSIIKFLFNPTANLLSCTSFPGPKEIQSLVIGHDILDASVAFSMLPGNLGIGIATLTYAGGLKFTLVADKATFSETQIQEILSAVVMELDILKSNLT